MKDFEAALTLLAGPTPVGPAFFELVSRALAVGLGCRWAAVVQLGEEKETAEFLARFADGAIVEGGSYLLAGTPCREVYQATTAADPHWFYPDHLAERFPEDKALAELGAVSYRGELFFDEGGEPRGHVFVMDDRPGEDTPQVRAFFRTVSQRVGSEFNRWRTVEALRRSEERFKDFAEATSDWFWEQDAELRFTSVSPGVFAKSGIEAEDHVGLTRRDTVTIGVSDAQWRRHDADLAARRPFRDFSFQRHDPDGRLRDLVISGKPVFDAEGEFKGYRGVGRDVTEHNRAERALRESRDQMRLITDNLPLAISYLDSERRYRFVNRTVEAWFGRPAEEILGRTIAEVLGQEADDSIAPLVMAALQGKKQHGERVIDYADGKTRILDLTYVPDIDESGLVRGSFAFGQDITERKQAEAALRESEARFREVLDSIPSPIYLKDVEGRYLFVNKAFEGRFGRKLGDMAGKTYEEVEFSTEEIARQHLAVEREVRDTRKIIERELPIRRADGSMGTGLVIRFPVFGAFGDLIAVGCSVNTDITERKQTEANLRELNARFTAFLDNVPDAISLKGADGRYVMVNAAFERMIGLSSDEILGKSHPELTSRDADIRSQIAAHERAVLESKAAIVQERDSVQRDGSVQSFIVTKFPVLDDSGNAVAIGTTNTNITEQKRSEGQLRQAQKMEAVGQLTAGVAHDFNNMLAVISGNAELLGDEVGEENPRLATLFRATERAAELTQRLLAFSRRQVLHPKVINANALIADVTGLLRRTLEEHIEIESVTDAGLWNCEVDPAQLESALVNLAINARDAMPKGGKLIIETANARLDDHAVAQSELKPGSYVMLAVSDNGSGMPAEVREHVFEPFFTTKTVGKGSGLGLSMVYGFVKQSGGHVTIYSEPGEGTTIKLYLPRSARTEVAEPRSAADEVPVARGETVFVVEDDPDVRTLTVTLLESLGYQTVEAATGAAALEMLGSMSGVNLLLTDVVLPGGMNGQELAVDAGRRVPGIRVLYMSGYTGDAILNHGRLDAGAELLQKPFRKIDLARAVRRVLDGASV